MAISKSKIQAMASRLNSTAKTVVTKEDYQSTLMKALAQYNQVDDKTLAKAVINFVKKQDKNKAAILSKAANWELVTSGKLVMIQNTGYLSPDHTKVLKQKIEEVYQKYLKVSKEVAVDDVKESKPKAPVISIEQRIIDAARTQSEDIDYAIDEFINTKATSFSTKSFLLQKGTSGAVAKKIADYYEYPLKEAQEALDGKCEQLVEGYSFFTKSELKKFIKFLQSIVDEARQHAVVSKKPRTIKPKAPGVVVKRLKYMIKYDELNMRSVDPATIVGADIVYVYNTKNRKLFKYESEDNSGLTVKGTTIINYSVTNSEAKTIRKPEIFFKNLNLGKRTMNKTFNDLKTKPNAVNGRVNQDCIILGAF